MVFWELLAGLLGCLTCLPGPVASGIILRRPETSGCLGLQMMLVGMLEENRCTGAAGRSHADFW